MKIKFKKSIITLTIIPVMALFGMPAWTFAEDGEALEGETVQEETQNEQQAEVSTQNAEEESKSSQGEEASTNTETSAASSNSEKNVEEQTEEGTDKNIVINFEVRVLLGEEPDILIEEKGISIPAEINLEDAINDELKKKNLQAIYEVQDYKKTINSIKDLTTDEEVQADYDKGYYWSIIINEKTFSEDIARAKVNNDDRILLEYSKNEENNENNIVYAPAPLNAAVTDPDLAETYEEATEVLNDAIAKGIKIEDISYSIVVFAMAQGETVSLKILNQYLAVLGKYLENMGSNKISETSATLNAMTVLTLAALGKDPTAFMGYDLLKPLTEFAYVNKGGIEGMAMALLALNSHVQYKIKESSKANIVNELCKKQNSDGGWGDKEKTSQVYLTALAVQALTPYYNNRQDATDAIDGAIDWLKSKQNDDGGFSASGESNAVDTSQVIIALISIGINPKTGFVKNGISPVDALASFKVGKGFAEYKGGSYSEKATQSVYLAMTAYNRFYSGKLFIYDMSMNELKKVEKQKAVRKKENKPKEQTQVTTGKTLTKSLSLIGLGNLSKEANETLNLIKAVNNMKLTGSARNYAADQIDAINKAYKSYMKLKPAEKLAVEKDESWKQFSEITDKLGKVYHYDDSTGVDLRNNESKALPWYVALIVNEKGLTPRQEKKVTEILGESSQVYASYDIKLVNTLEKEKWEPDTVINVKLKMPSMSDLKKAIIIHLCKNGRIEFIGGTVSDGGEDISFDTTEFSVYAVAGSENDIGSLLKEGKSVNILPWCIGAIVALAMALVVTVMRRKLTKKEQAR